MSDLNGRPVELAPELFMNLPCRATFSDYEADGALVNVTLTLGLTAEGVRPTAVKVADPSAERPISGTTLRAVKVHDLARYAIATAVYRGRPNYIEGRLVSIDELAEARVLSDEETRRIRAQGPVDESLRWVVDFYNLGLILGLPPARQVELSLGLPRTTASKWIRRAREAGMLNRDAALASELSDWPLPVHREDGHNGVNQ